MIPTGNEQKWRAPIRETGWGCFCGVMLGREGAQPPPPQAAVVAGPWGPPRLPPAGGRRRGGAPPKPLEKAVCPAGRRGFCFKQTFVLNL